jgi:3-hydroxyacyl-CoA dehydrogenase/enoyl-CoA hydratase/3-hydroxybutyryl-CoA epimerase
MIQFEDFFDIEVRDHIAICWIDNKTESMNVVSPAIIGFFDILGPRLQEDDDIHAVIFISRKPDFMAGADIKAFQIEKEGDFRPFQEKGHQALELIENSKKPFVSAIHGACLGLGTELSLACHGRIATDSSRTKMGLPEVQIGLLPGGGGTQRLPRLIGIQKALDMMLTGKQIDAYRCKKWGLVDALTAEGKLLHAAMVMAKSLIDKPLKRKRKQSFQERFLEGPLGRRLLFKQASKMALKQSQGNYPAIPAILDCVETGYKHGMAAGYEKELEGFERLMLTPESEALRSVFFGMTDNKKNPYTGSRPLQTLGMIGAGFMGAGIAQVSATKGIQVLLKDINQDMLTSAYQQIWKGIARKLQYKSISKIEAEQQIGNVTGQLTYAQFETADIVIEAVLEKMSLKKRIITDIQTHCREEVIIATNTSSLPVTEMADHAKKSNHVVGMHYFSPVPKMPLLEIVTTEHTEEWVLASCYDLGLKQGKTCIVVKDSPGFYVNRILAPYTNECLTMLDEGLAIETVDRTLKKKGFPVGPFSLLDEVGLDIAAHVTESSKKIVANRPGFVVHEAVVAMHNDGRKGRKNSKGFFSYDNKGKKKGPDATAYKYFKGDGKKNMDLAEIQDRATLLMINEAVLCLEEGIIRSPKDGDLGAVLGIGFPPFTGGPFRAIDTWGIDFVVDRMHELKDKYGERFQPANTLVEMKKTKILFFA